MEWFYFILAGMFVWSITSLVDKAVFNHYVEDKVFYTIFPAAIHFPVVCLLMLTPFVPQLMDAPLTSVLVAVGSGVFEFLLLVILFTAMGRDELSTVFPLSAISPVFTLFFGWILFGETLSQSEFIAFLLLIIGAFVVATKVTKGFSITTSRALWPVLLLAFFGSLSVIFFKAGITALDTWTALFYSRLGLLLAGVVVFSFPYFHRRIRLGWSRVPHNIRYVIFGNQVLAVFGHLFFFAALSVGTTALVSASFGIQYVMIFVMATVISWIWPRLLGEDTAASNLIRKAIGIALIVVAIVILNNVL